MTDPPDTSTPTPPPAPAPGHVPRLPSLRVTAALAAGMLAIGVAVGAAIGPAPSASEASSSLPGLLGSLVRIAAGRAAQSSSAAAQPPPALPEGTPARKRRSRAGKSASTPQTPSTTTTTSTSQATTPGSTTPTSTGNTKTTTLAPVTHVWLITLTGATFAQALAQPSAAPYIDSQLLPAGALLSSWSSLQGSALASEAGLLSGEPPQTLDSIVQPPCPEGAAGAQCAPEGAGALSAADEFLKATVPSLTASAAYREHGLIVITFGAVEDATASGLPAGSATATLSSQPPAGVLLISPFAAAGTRPASKYDPTSPKQSLSGLLH